MSTGRFPIASLPLPPIKDRLSQNLKPDPETPSIGSFQKDILREHPSIQRRSRIVHPSAHFSYTTPLPLPFPYRIPQPENPDDRDATMRNVESWLGQHEALAPVPQAGFCANGANESLKPQLEISSSSGQNEPLQQRHLLALSESCVHDCLPNLDIGDAMEHLSGAPEGQDKGLESSDQKKAARQELVDVLSGHSILMKPAAEGEPGYAPWSLRYCGHQFGVWAGQLGDGRAISILETPHPTQPDISYEVQLKGAGRTPYSRHADGLAVLRSSIREFLGAEAINALGIPTTRALSLISLPQIPVQRETLEKASITSRVAPSFIRIGSFEAHDTRETTVVYIFNPQATTDTADWEGMRLLGEWVTRRVLRIERKADEPWALNLVKESARRNAVMVAGWQAYGFMHGVMNTDNISVAGLTLDYGPYSFMDVYDNAHICNHTDEEGRYAFKFQPTMIVYAIRALLRSLAPVIGAEEELGHSAKPGWAANADSAQIELWRLDGLKHQSEIESIVMSVFTEEYYRLMRKRLGLRKVLKQDQNLVQTLLELLQAHELDFHSTFRTLSFFQPSIIQQASEDVSEDELTFIAQLNQNLADEKKGPATKAWSPWLRSYAARISEDKDEWNSGAGVENGGGWLQVRENVMKSANPRFVLRQWVLEEVIAKCEEGDLGKSRIILGKMLEMSTHPFRDWGGEGKSDAELNDEEKEERRLCSLGATAMLGFQCSCSS